MYTYADTHPRSQPHRENFRLVPLDDHELAMTEDGKTFLEEERDSMNVLVYVMGLSLLALIGLGYWVFLS